MLNTYKHLDIPDHELISEGLYRYIKDRTDFLQSDNKFWHWADVNDVLEHNIELNKYIDSLNLAVSFISIIIVDHNVPEVPHIDESTDCRILWPVVNCHTSETRFYTADNALLTDGQLAGNTNYKYIPDIKDCVIIDKLKLTQPAVFNPGIIHSVHLSDTVVPWISIAIGFIHHDDRKTSIDAW